MNYEQNQNPSTMLAAMMLQILNKHYTLAKYAHLFHLNVRGMLFHQFHAFFNDVYSNLYADIDLMAEKIRALGCLVEFGNYVDNENFVDISLNEALEIFSSYEEELKDLLVEATKFATEIDNFSIANFLSDQIDKHEKNLFMLYAMTSNS